MFLCQYLCIDLCICRELTSESDGVFQAERTKRKNNTSPRITSLLRSSIDERLFPTFQLMGGTSSSVDPGSGKENKLIDCLAEIAERLDASV
jgi:hypothetical protein